MSKVIAVMPAYNAAHTLERTYRDIPEDSVDEVIVVDDASQDSTVEVAHRLGLDVIRHPRNLGYGANQKTCYREALRRSADYIIMIHPDYQYDARVTPLMLGFLRAGIYDIILGSRIRTRKEALSGGMPLYKYLGNRFLTIVENLVLGQNLSEYQTGLRAYTRQVIETIPFENNSNGFVFDSEFLIQAITFGFRLGDVPISVRYLPDSSVISFRNSVLYAFGTLQTLGKYILNQNGLWQSPLFIRKSAVTGDDNKEY